MSGKDRVSETANFGQIMANCQLLFYTYTCNKLKIKREEFIVKIQKKDICKYMDRVAGNFHKHNCFS